MIKKIKSKRLRMLVVLLIVAAAVFAVLTVSWFVYYNTKVKPLMECLDKYEFFSEYDADGRRTYYDYHNEDERIGYGLSVPRFLNFFSDVQVLTGYLSELDPDTGEVTRITDYTYYFRYVAEVFGEGSYSFRIDDYTGTSDSFSDGVYHSSGPNEWYDIDVDKDMNFVSGNKVMYIEHYDQLKEVFDKTMEIFGEDAFR